MRHSATRGSKGSGAFHEARSQLRRSYLPVAGFSMVANLLMLAAPLYMLQVYDRVLTSHSQETLFFLTLIALAAFATYAAVDYVRCRLLVVTANWLDSRLRGAVLDASLNSARGTQSDVLKALRTVTNLRSALSGAGITSLMDAPWTPIFIVTLFLLHPAIGWLVMGGVLALLMLAIVNDFLSRGAYKDAEDTSAQSDLLSSEMVRNADAINAMGMMTGLRARLKSLNSDTLRPIDRASRRGGAISAVSRFVRYGLQIAVLGGGAYLVLQNEMSAGSIIAASILSARALAPVDMMISSWRNIAAARHSFATLKEFLNRTNASEAATQLPRPAGKLDVEGITYTPVASHGPVVNDVSFSLLPGECLGIMGPTGSGKTTIGRMLVGSLAPTAGHARLDGAEMAGWASEDRGRYIGYVPQVADVLPGTVRDNIARLGEAIDADVVQAAQIAGAHEMILRLPAGYDTLVGPGGIQLSGGQRQLIAHARALFGKPALVVLDEPNSNLDRDGEEQLVEVIRGLKRQRITSVIISHRFNLTRAVDKLLVVESGVLTAFGQRDAVLKKISPLVKHQGAVA